MGKSYKIRFLPQNTVLEVDLTHPPSSAHGKIRSILDIALAKDIEIDHACGGFAACSTCHVIVKEGLETCSEIEDDEADQLDKAPGLTMKSRLACQCVPDGSKDLVVEIPSWNRNQVKE